MNLRLVSIIAIASLVLSASARAEICGDVNLSSSLTTTDALLVLRGSVGQPVTLQCPSIAGLTECQGDLTTAGDALDFCTDDKQQCISDLDTCDGNLDEYVSDLAACTTQKDACDASLAECQNVTCGDDNADGGEQCDDTDVRGHTCATAAPLTPYGKLACDETCEFDITDCHARFDANGTTILDRKTGLEWQKKHGGDGTPTPADLQDVDNVYSWGSTSPPYAPNGTVFLDFLANLNGGLGVGTCFAGHCDWRIPSEEELLSIVDTSIPDCGTTEKPCVNVVFLPLHSDEAAVWSSTTHAGNPTGAKEVYLYTGDTFATGKTSSDPVMAVRTALVNP